MSTALIAEELRDIGHHLRADGRTLCALAVVPDPITNDTIPAIGNDLIWWGERLRTLSAALKREAQP